MQRSISISASIPLISNRPAKPPRVAPGVRLKVGSIAWAAVLIALGVGPTSVMAEDGPVTTMTALRSATNGLWIRVGTEVRARNEHFCEKAHAGCLDFTRGRQDTQTLLICGDLWAMTQEP
jgi:hypothetical protein